MKISVIRSGGFAGLAEKVVEIDTTQIGVATAQQVKQMMQSIGFFDLPAFVSGGTIGADLFHYEITASDVGRQHTVGFDDDDSPETAPLRKLLGILTKLM